jgi:hypothetical protein
VQTSEDYRDQAESCRRIARAISLRDHKRELLDMAEEYERKAELLFAPRPPTER